MFQHAFKIPLPGTFCMLDALLQILSPLLLAISLAGVCLGIIWGALPGLSTTMAMGC